MNFLESNSHYERWLKRVVPTEPKDFKYKHSRMDESEFVFFRGTFFRWHQRFVELLHAIDAPQVLSVGDLHVENFGTWRDLEGRLCWGVNDFDEAYPLPYVYDLIRLAASIEISGENNLMDLDLRDAIEALLEGYEAGLRRGGKPFVLDESHPWLTSIAMARLKDSNEYWRKLKSVAQKRAKVLPIAREILMQNLPREAEDHAFGPRIAGVGSLGRKRVVILAQLAGSTVARETKPLAPSAVRWATGKHSANTKIYYSQIVDRAIRMPDPYLNVHKEGRDTWVVRRLSPQCSRIELESLPRKNEALHLVRSMGFETANVHLGTANAKAVLKDLKSRKIKHWCGWVDEMVDAVYSDWKAWRRR